MTTTHYAPLTEAEAVNRFGELTRLLHMTAGALAELASAAPVLMQVTPTSNLEALNNQLAATYAAIEQEIDRRPVESNMEPGPRTVDLAEAFSDPSTCQHVANVLGRALDQS